jgi:hypothetical protein
MPAGEGWSKQFKARRPAPAASVAQPPAPAPSTAVDKGWMSAFIKGVK